MTEWLCLLSLKFYVTSNEVHWSTVLSRMVSFFDPIDITTNAWVDLAFGAEITSLIFVHVSLKKRFYDAT